MSVAVTSENLSEFFARPKVTFLILLHKNRWLQHEFVTSAFLQLFFPYKKSEGAWNINQEL